MAAIIDSLVRVNNYLFIDLADPRTNDWFLIKSPFPALAILYLYHQFTRKWGPRLMENRKPVQMQKTLLVYNFIQVIVSCWIFYEGLAAGWATTYSWKCQPVDFSRSPEAMRVARAVYIYFLAKMTELLDTVFFVIRKKDKQVTFLHLYHHTVMPMISWGCTKYYPGGHGTLIGVINSFVHIIMYTYYLLAAMGPQYQKYLFWKKHITTLQMLQFCITFLHSAQLLVYDCGFPRWSVIFTLPNSIFFYYLFYDFYYKAYGTPEERRIAKEKELKAKNANGTTNGIVTNGHAMNVKNGYDADGNAMNGKNGHVANGKNGHITNGVTRESNNNVGKKVD